MSLAIVLGGWTAASILLSPLIGRFLSTSDESEYSGKPRRIGFEKSLPNPRPRHGSNGGVRRNVAIQLYRREAGTPRAG